MMMIATTTVEGKHITRTNFGYSLQSTDEAYLINGHARLLFYYSIPEIILHTHSAMRKHGKYMLTLFTCNTNLTVIGMTREDCRHVFRIAKKLHNLKSDMTYLTYQRQRGIYELLFQITELRRNRRGLGCFIGSGQSYAFGLATADDLNEMADLMKRVLDGTKRAIQAWKVGQNLVTHITELTTHRFNNIDQMLNLSRGTLMQENERLQALKVQGQTTKRFLAVAIEEIHIIITHVQQLESLYMALREFTHGKLSHNLVDVDQLQDNIRLLSSTLEKNLDTQLLYITTDYYYSYADVTRAFTIIYVDRHYLFLLKLPPY